jgi:hypothetical protein
MRTTGRALRFWEETFRKTAAGAGRVIIQVSTSPIGCMPVLPCGLREDWHVTIGLPLGVGDVNLGRIAAEQQILRANMDVLVDVGTGLEGVWPADRLMSSFMIFPVQS